MHSIVDLHEYDGLVAVGGDSLLHELVSGMLLREDGARVPIGVLPAGKEPGWIMDVCNSIYV